MWGRASVRTRIAFVFSLVFAVFGLIWVVAEIIRDPGGAGWPLGGGIVVAAVVLTVIAVIAEPLGRVLLALGVLLLAAFALLEAFVGILPADAGPVVAVTVLVFVAPLAVLGLLDAGYAAALLLVAGVVPLVARYIALWTAVEGEGPGGMALLGGSSGAVAIPTIVAGLLFLAAWRPRRQ